MDCFTSFAMTALSDSGRGYWYFCLMVEPLRVPPPLGGDGLLCSQKTTAPTVEAEAVPHQTNEVFFASFFFRKKKSLAYLSEAFSFSSAAEPGISSSSDMLLNGLSEVSRKPCRSSASGST